MKYNTVRSLLENYYQYGRINVKKKQKGYKKGKNRKNSKEKSKSYGSKNSSTILAQQGTRQYRREFLQNKVEIISQK